MGMDVDPIALDKAQDRISDFFSEDSDLKAYIVLKNFKYLKSLLADSDEKPLDPGVDGILMDLGMSSMQVCERKSINIQNTQLSVVESKLVCSSI